MTLTVWKKFVRTQMKTWFAHVMQYYSETKLDNLKQHTINYF